MPSDDEFFKQAEDAKAQGNAAFVAGDITGAIQAYSSGLVLMDRVTSKKFVVTNHPASMTTSLQDDLECVLLSNRAAARLKLGEHQPCTTTSEQAAVVRLWTDAVADCTAALPLCTKDEKLRCKILFRSAKSRFLLANVKDAASTLNVEHLSAAAKDLVTLLQTDPKNHDANQLMQVIRTQHKKETINTQTPLTKLLKALEHNTDAPTTLQNLKLLLGLLQNDVSNGAMELGRSDGVPILLQLASTKAPDKSPVLASQCLAMAASHPPFCRTFLVPRQSQLVPLLTTICQAKDNTFQSDQIVSYLSLLDRLVLHADRDPTTHNSVVDHSDVDTTMVIASLELALQAQPLTPLVIRAVLNVWAVWTAAGRDRETRIRSVAPHDLPPPKTPQEIRSFTPPQLAEYKKRQLALTERDAQWALDRSLALVAAPAFRRILSVAVNSCPDHTVRREMTVAVSRLWTCIPNDELIQQTVRPFLSDTRPVIEEINEKTEEAVVGPSLTTKMERALLTTALLLSKKECGIWALTNGWSDAGSELTDLIQSDHAVAQCLAAEVLQAAAVVEQTRSVVLSLVSSGCMEVLMRSTDRDVRSGAAAAVAKLGLSDKATQSNEGELMGLLQAACEMLEDDDGAEANSEVTKENFKETFSKFSSVATSSVERAIEMMTYLVAHTVVKEELAAGFGSQRTGKSALDCLVQAADLPGAGESLSGFGLASIFQLMAVTNDQLRKEAFEGKEVTMEQYDEMQRMGKTEEEKEIMDQEKDTDTKEGCNDRLRKMASGNVPRALVALTEGASEHTLEQLTLAMNRMAEEQSVRGIMIQQGVLSACIKVEKAEGPTETDVMKKVIRTARHCMAKMLITTNPGLLTSAQKLGSIRPLIQLIRDIKATDLQHFEALMALTNIASSGEDATNRIVSERGIACLHFAMFSDHEMVRRAATEAMCNLVQHQAMIDHLAEVDNMRLWMAFAVDYEDHYECARASGGCLAMASQDESIALVIVDLEKFKEQISALLESGRLELMQRVLVVVLNLVSHGSTTKQRTIEAGLVDFCRAYIELQKHAAVSGGDGELEFSDEERQLLPVTVDIAKKIVQAADEK